MDNTFSAITLPLADNSGGNLLLYIALMIAVPAILLIGLLCLIVKLSTSSNEDSGNAGTDQPNGEWLDDDGK